MSSNVCRTSLKQPKDDHDNKDIEHVGLHALIGTPERRNEMYRTPETLVRADSESIKDPLVQTLGESDFQRFPSAAQVKSSVVVVRAMPL